MVRIVVHSKYHLLFALFLSLAAFFSVKRLQDPKRNEILQIDDPLPTNIDELIERLQQDINDSGLNLHKRAKAVHWPLDRANLERWLRVAHYNLFYHGKPLLKHIESSLSWRESFGACCISHADIYDELSDPLMNGYDRFGRPLLIFKLGAREKLDFFATQKLLVYTVERAISMMKPNSQQRFMVIVDCEGMKLLPPLSHVIKIFKLLKAHYPSRLGKILVVNAGVAVSGIWNVARGVLPERTTRKITFLSPEEVSSTVLKYVTPENLEKKYGGTGTFVFNRDKYVAQYKPKKRKGKMKLLW